MKAVFENFLGYGGLIDRSWEDLVEIANGAEYIHFAIVEGSTSKILRDMSSIMKDFQKKPTGAVVQINSNASLRTDYIGALFDKMSENMSPDAKILWGVSIDKKQRNPKVGVMFAVKRKNESRKKTKKERTKKQKIHER